MVARLVATGVGAAMLFATGVSFAESPRRSAREVIFATETTGAPPGYHPDTQLRLGPLIGGGVTTFFGGVTMADGVLDPDRQGGVFLRIVGGIHLAVGLPLLVYGLAVPRDVYVRDSAPRISFDVIPSHRNPRLVVTAAF